jgi:AcrR family transcriptional regulator
MPRWEHGSEERLKQAAMELFEEQGFEDTSAVQIAKRARVTTRTFFRYFPDKEEVLFADADTLHEALIQELLQTPDVKEPLRAVTRTLAGFDWKSSDHANPSTGGTRWSRRIPGCWSGN